MATNQEPGRDQRRVASSREFPIADQYQDDEELEEAGSATPSATEYRIGPIPINPIKAVPTASSDLDHSGSDQQQEEEEEEIPRPESAQPAPLADNAGSTADQHATTYLSGIDGESTDDKHKGEIDLEFGSGAREAIGRNGLLDDHGTIVEQGTIVDQGAITQKGTIADAAVTDEAHRMVDSAVTDQGSIIEASPVDETREEPQRASDLDDEGLDLDA